MAIVMHMFCAMWLEGGGWKLQDRNDGRGEKGSSGDQVLGGFLNVILYKRRYGRGAICI